MTNYTLFIYFCRNTDRRGGIMTKILRKSLLAAALVIAAVCTATVTAMFARSASADVYDIQAVSDEIPANWLVDGNGNPYSIPNHVFGDKSFSVDTPKTFYEVADKSMQITLSRNSKALVFAVDFGVNDKLSYYINSAMPAGNYSLKIAVSGSYGSSFSETFAFTVEEAPLPSPKEVHDKLEKKLFESEITDSAIYDVDAQTAVSGYLANKIAVDRSNTYWENLDEYYCDYPVEFSLLEGFNDTYKHKSAFLSSIADPATYKVYYRISAKNYYGGTEALDGYYFTLNRYEVLNVPTIADRTANGDLIYRYTGYDVIPNVTGNDIYSVRWTDKEYVSGGVHYVTFRLMDNVHYRWKGVTGIDAVADFTIGQATNWFTTSLNFIGWDYGSFDRGINNIRGAVAFLDTGKDILFSVTKEDGTEIDGLAGFIVNGDGQVTDEVEEQLKKLDSGRYKLVATVEATKNYKKVSNYIYFNIDKAQNSWKDGDDDLILPNWVEGRYDKGNPITIKAEHGTVNFKIVDIDENEYYNTADANADLVSVLNSLDVGKYLLVAWVDGDANYYGLLDRTFTIQIFEKPGLPWWAVLLIVAGSLGLAALILFILWKKGVFQLLTRRIFVAIRTSASVEATIASIRAAKMMEEGRKSVEEAKQREMLENGSEKEE